MADTEKSEQPQTNGIENGLDEDERTKLRPADIDADVKEMERRKRVEMIMSSKLFREELERIIELQMKDGNGPAGLLQQISDMMGIQSGKLHTTHMFRGSNCVTPINDIRGVESMGYEKGEKNLRCKLASVFRLMDLYGWSQGIHNQITARLNQDEEHFLVNPHGMLYNEITASSLVKVDMQGNIVEPGTTNFNVNTQGFLLHSAIHATRPDVNCVIHIKTPSVLAVSSLKGGLLPLCHEALVIGEVSQHPFVSGIFEPEEREKIIRNLGPTNKVLLLHNHGAVCCGATVEEAFYNVYNTVMACETQMKLMPMGVENLLLLNDETRKQVYDAAHRAPDTGAQGDKKAKQFRVGELEFEALIRMLDNAGFRTGYIYRHPLVKGELPKPKNDVEVPPAVSSLGYLIEQEELYKQGNWKKYIDGRNRLDRTKWLNSPNVYQKVEILETGTSDPKKITKWVDQNSEEWVAESSPTHSSTPVKIDSALQFVPKGTNPKEFKKLQQQIKENRRADKITSGPQSHILEGVSWEDAKKLQDANITHTGDQVILVGAASKGIIQRNYQHNALVYKTPYAKNPFDSMSDKEIEDYKQLVERKQRGDTDYEESQSESEAISSSRQDALRHIKSPLLSPQSATSETEEESRDEPRVLRIETKTAPRPIQAEVVLSDAESDSTDARVERSHSARYPKAEKPESVNLMNSFRKSWSLKREKDKSKDIENPEGYDSRNLLPSLMLTESEHGFDRVEPLHCYIAQVKHLSQKPIILDLNTKTLRPLLKCASDPCNLSNLSNEDISGLDNTLGSTKGSTTSYSYNSILNSSDLQRRLNIRKKLIYSAKMKFLGFHDTDTKNELTEKAPTSPMCALISEIRDTINEIVSPERGKVTEESLDDFTSMRWIERPKFVPRDTEVENESTKQNQDTPDSETTRKCSTNLFESEPRAETALPEGLTDFKNDFEILEKSEISGLADRLNFTSVLEEIRNYQKNKKFENKQIVEGVMTEIVEKVYISDDEATYTVKEDSLLQTYSFAESTETEWYYNKTIMKLDNSQTVLEIKNEGKEDENQEMQAGKYVDTGIDTDFTSEKENEGKSQSDNPREGELLLNTSEEIDAPVCESSVLNKSSETDSSFLKSSSGRTSNDIDTSFAFKTETENSEKTIEKQDNSDSIGLDRSSEDKKKFLEGMLGSCESEKVDGNDDGVLESLDTSKQKQFETSLPGIPESPEFTNVDTEDAPVTSSSKDTSPDYPANIEQLTEDEHVQQTKEDPNVILEKGEDQDLPEEKTAKQRKRKKNKKSSTKITVKKELREKNSTEPVISEIKLTIKNLNQCQSEKYEVKIQDVTNTSEELSRSASSMGENVETYETFEVGESSCECDAQQNLEELQEEVSSTIEKLQTIENFFEDEIRKHSPKEIEDVEGKSPGKGGEEFTIEYNYRESEEVLNESKDEMVLLNVIQDDKVLKDKEMPKENYSQIGGRDFAEDLPGLKAEVCDQYENVGEYCKEETVSDNRLLERAVNEYKEEEVFYGPVSDNNYQPAVAEGEYNQVEVVNDCNQDVLICKREVVLGDYQQEVVLGSYQEEVVLDNFYENIGKFRKEEIVDNFEQKIVNKCEKEENEQKVILTENFQIEDIVDNVQREVPVDFFEQKIINGNEKEEYQHQREVVLGNYQGEVAQDYFQQEVVLVDSFQEEVVADNFEQKIISGNKKEEDGRYQEVVVGQEELVLDSFREEFIKEYRQEEEEVNRKVVVSHNQEEEVLDNNILEETVIDNLEQKIMNGCEKEENDDKMEKIVVNNYQNEVVTNNSEQEVLSEWQKKANEILQEVEVTDTFKHEAIPEIFQQDVINQFQREPDEDEEEIVVDKFQPNLVVGDSYHPEVVVDNFEQEIINECNLDEYESQQEVLAEDHVQQEIIGQLQFVIENGCQEEIFQQDGINNLEREEVGNFFQEVVTVADLAQDDVIENSNFQPEAVAEASYQEELVLDRLERETSNECEIKANEKEEGEGEEEVVVATDNFQINGFEENKYQPEVGISVTEEEIVEEYQPELGIEYGEEVVADYIQLEVATEKVIRDNYLPGQINGYLIENEYERETDNEYTYEEMPYEHQKEAISPSYQRDVIAVNGYELSELVSNDYEPEDLSTFEQEEVIHAHQKETAAIVVEDNHHQTEKDYQKEENENQHEVVNEFNEEEILDRTKQPEVVINGYNQVEPHVLEGNDKQEILSEYQEQIALDNAQPEVVNERREEEVEEAILDNSQTGAVSNGYGEEEVAHEYQLEVVKDNSQMSGLDSKGGIIIFDDYQEEVVIMAGDEDEQKFTKDDVCCLYQEFNTGDGPYTPRTNSLNGPYARSNTGNVPYTPRTNGDSDNKEESKFLEYLKHLYHKFSSPLKAITWYAIKESPRSTIKEESPSKEEEMSNEEMNRRKMDFHDTGEMVEGIVDDLLNKVVKEDPSMSDIISFLLNEESPTDSLAEFEDMENIVSTSTSVIADIIGSVESQLEGDVESLPDEEDMKEEEDVKVIKMKKKKKDSMFKVTIATPTKKEIFINYSPNSSSTFNLSSDLDRQTELCNSYIKTDDINDDFESLSSDNLDYFSMGSPGKNSLNSSFASATSAAEGCLNPNGSHCCCPEYEDTETKSPRSLGIIEEVEELDSSASSDVVPKVQNGLCAIDYVHNSPCRMVYFLDSSQHISQGENTINGDHSDAHQSTFSHSSKEGSPTKDRSTEESPKKDKKKKKGLRTPSFLKKKKEKKKIAESS